MLTYSNPRMAHEVSNWPSGKHEVLAKFSIEQHPTRGERAVRVTHHPLTGVPSAPKKRTFVRKARIVDGSDGRTYIAEFVGSHTYISIANGDMQYHHESVFPGDARYGELLSLFKLKE